METAVIPLMILAVISGLSHGGGVLPDNLHGAEGGSVMFNTTVTPPETPFGTVSWNFVSVNSLINILISLPTADIVAPEYENRITFIRSTGSLELRKLTLKDTGEYNIVITSHDGKQMTGNCRLEIFTVSAVSITEPPDQLVEGDSVNLTCDAAGSVSTREWRKDGSLLTSGNNIILHDNNRVLSFSPVRRTDRGEYSCKVSNPVSFDEAKYQMTVNYGPEKGKITGPNVIAVNEPLKLTCSAESTPTASYTWKRNGTEILRDSAEFSKSATDPSDSGEYTCEATNSVTGLIWRSDVHGLSVTEKESGSLSAGAIAGIVIVSLKIVGWVVGGAVYYMHKKRRIIDPSTQREHIYENPEPTCENYPAGSDDTGKRQKTSLPLKEK